MSNNPNKDKGTRWERDAAEILNKEFPNVWQRIPMSGALGTQLGIPILEGDLKGKYSFLPFPFIAEAKVGYGGTQMKIQKEWFDKVSESAKKLYAVPIVLLKFEKARSGVKHVVAMDFYVWDTLMTRIEELHEESIKLRDELDELRRRIT